MKVITPLILLVLFFSKSFAQSEFIYDEKAVEFRTKLIVPPYGLTKVKQLIAGIVYKEDPNNGSDAGIDALNITQFKALTLREKFTYVMIHAESTSQNCDIPEYQKDIEKKIFAHLLSGFNEAEWSQRQMDFLVENRDSVINLIKESVSRSKRMGVNYKEALLEINAWEAIPFIIEYAKSTPLDKDALTLLNLLMKRGEHSEFTKSTTFEKLYGKESNYYSYLNYNQANEDLIFKRATNYYQGRKK